MIAFSCICSLNAMNQSVATIIHCLTFPWVGLVHACTVANAPVIIFSWFSRVALLVDRRGSVVGGCMVVACDPW